MHCDDPKVESEIRSHRSKVGLVLMSVPEPTTGRLVQPGHFGSGVLLVTGDDVLTALWAGFSPGEVEYMLDLLPGRITGLS